jgi:hypothetical protein
MAFDVPLEVTIVIVVAWAEPRFGTVTVHDDCVGQLVGAGAPPNEAVIRPSELKKPEPVTSTV